jgi:hypothetical protein
MNMAAYMLTIKVTQQWRSSACLCSVSVIISLNTLWTAFISTMSLFSSFWQALMSFKSVLASAYLLFNFSQLVLAGIEHI